MGIMCTRDHPLTCTDADKYVFWDAFHLTDRTNQIISAYLFKDLKSKFLSCSVIIGGCLVEFRRKRKVAIFMGVE